MKIFRGGIRVKTLFYLKSQLALKTPKMLITEVICCKFLLPYLTNLSMETNSKGRDQTSPSEAV